jgi:hypothetical protein
MTSIKKAMVADAVCGSSCEGMGGPGRGDEDPGVESTPSTDATGNKDDRSALAV